MAPLPWNPRLGFILWERLVSMAPPGFGWSSSCGERKKPVVAFVVQCVLFCHPVVVELGTPTLFDSARLVRY